MEKINKKISNIEKALTEMQKEIIFIKNNASNTNATNSLNVSNNFANKNNLSIKTNRESLHKQKSFLKLSKNYFQLTEKEKYFPKEKKLLKNTHSFNLNKKGLNIYNNIFVNSENSFNSNTKDDKYETIEPEIINKNNDNKNQVKLNLLLNENQKTNNKKFKINDYTVNKSYRDNLKNKNHDLFYNYKLNNNNNHFQQYFANNMKSFNKSHTKRLNKNIKHSNSSLFYITKRKNKNKSNNKKENDFDKLINFTKDENDDDISCSYNYKKEYEKDIKNLYHKNKYNQQEEFKSYQSYQSSIDENTDINECIVYYQKNKRQKKSSHNSKKEQKIKIYSQILNVLGDESINNLISKSNLFDKYGTKGFQQYIINNRINFPKNNSDTEKYLNEYKNYILSIDKQDENDGQIKKYKSLYNKLIKITNSSDIEQLIEDIDFKLRKNSNNKGFLEKVKNILKAY